MSAELVQVEFSCILLGIRGQGEGEKELCESRCEVHSVSKCFDYDLLSEVRAIVWENRVVCEGIQHWTRTPYYRAWSVCDKL